MLFLTALKVISNQLNQSLINIIRILEDFKVIGLVEPLGFKQSSLRLKSITINIINSLQSKKLKIICFIKGVVLKSNIIV